MTAANDTRGDEASAEETIDAIADQVLALAEEIEGFTHELTDAKRREVAQAAVAAIASGVARLRRAIRLT